MQEEKVKLSHVLIFGGSGFVGTHLARRLANKPGTKVTLADILPPKFPIDGVAYIEADVREPIQIDVEDPIDLVINTAAVHRVPGHQDYEYYETNVNGARNVIQFCERHEVARLVFTSSISVYGPSEEALTEASTLVPTTAYGKSKQQAEEIHIAWQQASPERRLVIVRPAVIFGPGENGNFTRLAAALKRGTFVYPGRRDAIKACGYVLDLVSSIEFALDLDRPFFLYNFAHPARNTTEKICEAFRSVAGFHRPIGSIPQWLILTVAAIAEFVPGVEAKTGISRTRVRKLMESTNILPATLEAEGFKFEYDLESALADWLAHPPTGQFV